MRKTLISSIIALAMIGGITFNSDSVASNNTNDIDKKIENKINTMTIEEKVGQMMFVGINGTKIDNKITRLLKEQHPGGIILYGARNFSGKTIEDNIELINSIKKANNKKSDIPLFIGIDEEGSRLSQLPRELIKIPEKGEIGNTNDASLATNLGSVTGKKLNVLGINTDFGTVLDINTNKNNPVIGIRSYGATKEKVTNFGVNEMKAIKGEGVIPTVKHFPGHGDTETDSHLGLPSLNHDIERLRSTELVPFQAAIDNGADMVMTAHIMLPQIDKEYPATLSKKIINDLLRGEMGYKGIVITDDLEMQAIVNNWGIGEAAVKSIQAGTDILLVCHTIDNQEKVYNSILKGVKDGTLIEKRIDESVRRILNLKYKYNLSDKAVNPTQDDIWNVSEYGYEQLAKYNSKVVEAMYK